MGIKVKLNLIVLTVIITLLMSQAVTWLLNKPLEKMDHEKQILIDLEMSLLAFQGVVNEYNRTHFRGHASRWKQKRNDVGKSFASLDEIENLLKIDPEVLEAVEATKGLSAILYERMDIIESQQKVLEGYADAIFPRSLAFTLMNVYTDRETYYGKEGFPELYKATQEFLGNLDVINQNILSSITSLNKHKKTIENYTDEIKRNTLIVTILINVMGFIMSFLFSSFFSRGIVRNIKFFCDRTNLLARGDLTGDISVKSKGEFSILAEDMTALQEQFRQSLGNIQNVAHQNEKVKQELLIMADETNSTSRRIEKSSKGIEDRMSGFSRDMDNTDMATKNIRTRVDRLNESIMNQISMVEESSASVQHMINSIEQISAKTSGSKTAAARLVQTAKEGGEKLNFTIDVLRQVEEHVGDIRNMVTMINGIAAQTNLLAMNAAIEAAHAGDAGKGFSVVADEIRKLAEAAAGNSKEIGSSLQRINKSVEESMEAGMVTRDSFLEIDKIIEEVSSALMNIDDNMNELSSGSQQILQSTGELTVITHSINDGAGEIQSNAEKISEDMEKMSSLSHNVSLSIKEITGGIGNIGDSVGAINDVSRLIGNLSDNLSREVMVFKTEKE